MFLPSGKDASCFKKDFTDGSQLFRHPFFFWRFDAEVMKSLRQSVIDSRIGDAIFSITRPAFDQKMAIIGDRSLKDTYLQLSYPTPKKMDCV